MDFPCEDCENYEYDEEQECSICAVDMDMDEFERCVLAPQPPGAPAARCPYYRVRDDYRIVRRQN